MTQLAQLPSWQSNSNWDLQEIPIKLRGKVFQVAQIAHYIKHAERQIDQIDRRVLKGEVIPHSEKVFSIFEEHTEWVCKGKTGVPVELGVRVSVIEDQYQFVLHHDVVNHFSSCRRKPGISISIGAST